MKRSLNCFGALVLLISACTKSAEVPQGTAVEPEALSRTEFTNRLENFFEYEPLRSGKSSQVRIHLTDLLDGSPVEQAQVTLAARPKGSQSQSSLATAKIGKVTGIYVADLTLPAPGEYDIEFHIKNNKLDER